MNNSKYYAFMIRITFAAKMKIMLRNITPYFLYFIIPFIQVSLPKTYPFTIKNYPGKSVHKKI